jgi:hypothetical protein
MEATCCGAEVTGKEVLGAKKGLIVTMKENYCSLVHRGRDSLEEVEGMWAHKKRELVAVSVVAQESFN